jgi:hypothetical protein
MRTHDGNVGAVIADIGAVTFATLTKFGIPYDEIYFGKPWAHVYVDDLAVHANLDTRKEIGWLTEDPNGNENNFADATKAKKAGMVASRTFNHVQIVGSRIIKSSRSPQLLGEMWFYTHIPDDIADLFPKAYDIGVEQETSTYSFVLEKLKGISYSHLLVGRSLTPGRLSILLHAINRIHGASTKTTCGLGVPQDIQGMFDEMVASEPEKQLNIYANYGDKLRQRYQIFRSDYDALGTLAKRTFTDILYRVDDYELHKRGHLAEVIHGDPVFSNAILIDETCRVGLFDVRCQLGSRLTMAGDVSYDLAKILQSLSGYDHALVHVSPLEDKSDWRSSWMDYEDKLFLKSLQDEFWKFVVEAYGERVKKQDVINITASLLFSLIPLHPVDMRPVFLSMCANVLRTGSAWESA